MGLLPRRIFRSCFYVKIHIKRVKTKAERTPFKGSHEWDVWGTAVPWESTEDSWSRRMIEPELLS